MSKFKIGDRVIANCNYEGYSTKNKKGKVIDIITHVYDVAVEFDEAIENCHAAAGVGKDGHCLYMRDYCLELIPKNNNKIVITTDGTETLARLYDGNKVIKSAVAKCSPDDTFDFGTGAIIAFDRLMEDKKAEEKKHKYKAGDKVKVISNTCHHFCEIGETVTLTNIFCSETKGVNWHIKEHFGYIRDCDFIPYTAEEEKPKIKVGDRVKVVATGALYTTYDKWFEKNAPELAVYYQYGCPIDVEAEYIVKKIAPHCFFNNKCCAIQNIKNNAVYLIGEQGIARA